MQQRSMRDGLMRGGLKKLTLNSLCGISLNATHDLFVSPIFPLQIDSQFPLWDFFECNRCRFGCFSGNRRGKSAGLTAYPAPATALIKIRTLFKFIAGGCGPTQSTSHGSCLNQASNPFLKGFFAQAIGQGRAYLRRRTAGSP